MEARNISEVITGYYIKNKKRLLKEAIESDNVQLSNTLIKLYESLGENLDDIFDKGEAKEVKASSNDDVNLSEIFAKKLR